MTESLPSPVANSQQDPAGFNPAPVVPLVSQPPARLIVDSPLPAQLATGYVVVRYRAENLRIMPVYGPTLCVFFPASDTCTSPLMICPGIGSTPVVNRSALMGFHRGHTSFLSNSRVRPTRLSTARPSTLKSFNGSNPEP